jgi:hypothetical protein
VGWRCSKVGPLLGLVKPAVFPEVRMGITSSTSLGNLRSSRLTLITGAVHLYRSWNGQYKKWNPLMTAHPIYGKGQKDSPIGRLVCFGRKVPKCGTPTQNVELPFREKQVTKFHPFNFFGGRGRVSRTGVCTGYSFNCPVRKAS